MAATIGSGTGEAWRKERDRMQEVVAKHEEVVYSKYELVRVTNHDRVSSIVGKHALLNHWHEELEITYNIEGRGIYYIDGQRIQGEPGRLIVINSESVHSIVPDETMINDGIHAVTVLLHPKFLEENFPKYKEFLFANGKCQTRPEIQDIMLKLSECGLREEIRPHEYPFYVKGLLLQLLYYMQEEGMIRREEAFSTEQCASIKNLKKILSYVEEHYSEPIFQADVAERFHFTQQYFSRYFKKNTDITFTEFVMRYRVQQARKSLVESDKRILDIALENGFTDERRFITTFKKFYQETPFQYRKKLMSL